MRCVKEVLRQKWVLKKSNRQVASSLNISAGYVSGVVTRAVATGLSTWAEVDALTEELLEERLYGPKVKAGSARPLPDGHLQYLPVMAPAATPARPCPGQLTATSGNARPPLLSPAAPPAVRTGPDAWPVGPPLRRGPCNDGRPGAMLYF